jgi:ssDNA-binding Zn-finger/Zn-ribbon topoisomerase 1
MDLIPFAFDINSKQIVDIGSVPSGLACKCVCPSCKHPLVAKKGNVNKWHFSHQPNVDYEDICLYTPARAARAMLMQMLPSLKLINTPDYVHVATGTIITTSTAVELTSVKVCDDNEQPHNAILSVGKHTILLYLGLSNIDKPKSLNAEHSMLFVDLNRFIEIFTNENRLTATEQLWRMMSLPHPAKEWVYHVKEKSLKFKPQRPNPLRLAQNKLPPIKIGASDGTAIIPMSAKFICIPCNHKYDGIIPGLNPCPKCNEYMYRKKLPT